MRAILFMCLALAGCSAATSPTAVDIIAIAEPSATPTPTAAPVRAFDAELVGRLGGGRIWTNLPIPGRVTVRWRAYEVALGEWFQVDETTVDVGPLGEVFVEPGSGTTVLCRQYTVELVGQGWKAMDWALCCPRYPCPVD